MVGSGEPPMLLQVSSIGLSSVATAMEPGEITGGCGGVRTVTLWNSWCTSAPVPWALMRHSKRPLSRLYETFFICRSYMPRSGWKSSLQRKTNDEIYDVIFFYIFIDCFTRKFEMSIMIFFFFFCRSQFSIYFIWFSACLVWHLPHAQPTSLLYRTSLIVLILGFQLGIP